MTRASSPLTAILLVVQGWMKKNGFSRRGGMFHRQADDGNTLLLEVQRRKLTVPRLELTINYGVYSALLGNKLQDAASQKPTSALAISDAHWWRRLRKGGQESWVSIEVTEPPAESAQGVRAAIVELLPELLSHASNASLRDEWLAGSSPGLTNMQRLIFLSVLIHEIGPRARLPEVVAELRGLVAGSVHEHLVERDLARAGVDVGVVR